MSTRPTDAVSAALVAFAVWVTGRRNDRTRSELLRAGPFLGGAVLAVLAEAAFARWPDRMARLWQRPAVRFGSPAALLLATLSAGRRSGVAYAATLGGLAGYFALLVGIIAGVVPEPERWFVRQRN